MGKRCHGNGIYCLIYHFVGQVSITTLNSDGLLEGCEAPSFYYHLDDVDLVGGSCNIILGPHLFHCSVDFHKRLRRSSFKEPDMLLVADGGCCGGPCSAFQLDGDEFALFFSSSTGVSSMRARAVLVFILVEKVAEVIALKG